MRINYLLALSGLTLITSLSACQNTSLPPTSLLADDQAQSLTIRGRVGFPSSFKTTATLGDIQPFASVSLIYLPDHPSLANQTIVTGLTNASGVFTLNPEVAFTPSIDSLYLLEAAKRINGPGNALMTVRTYLKWTVGGWQSITTPEIVLNANTTALTVMDAYDNNLNANMTIGSVNSNTGQASTIGSITAGSIEQVGDMVTALLGQNQDPVSQIQRINSSYRIRDQDLTLNLIAAGGCPGCDLKHVNLSFQNLTNVNLTGADLSQAVLNFTNLQGAQLQGANLQGASLINATWTNGKYCDEDSIGQCNQTTTPPNANVSAFRGYVYDDNGIPLADVVVETRTLADSSYSSVTTTGTDGSFRILNAPTNKQLEIVTQKTGFTKRRRVEILGRGTSLNANRYDFGTDEGFNGLSEFGIGYHGMSDKPEVVSVFPERNEAGVNPRTAIVIEFSEPMDKDSVLRNFGLYVANTVMLSADTQVLNESISSLTGLSANGQAVTFKGVGGVAANSYNAWEALSGATRIYSLVRYTATWSQNDTKVTFRTTPMFSFPSDKDVNRVPRYLISFAPVHSDGRIVDKNSNVRTEDTGYFKLTDGGYEMWSVFEPERDTSPPQVEFIQAEKLATAGSDCITVHFTEPMGHNTSAGLIMGLNNLRLTAYDVGDGIPSKSPRDADNYEISTNGVNFFPLGTETRTVKSIHLDPDDSTKVQIFLDPADNIFSAGNRVYLRVRDSVTDPAGNRLEAYSLPNTIAF